MLRILTLAVNSENFKDIPTTKQTEQADYKESNHNVIGNTNTAKDESQPQGGSIDTEIHPSPFPNEDMRLLPANRRKKRTTTTLTGETLRKKLEFLPNFLNE